MIDSTEHNGNALAQHPAPGRRERIARERIRLGAMGVALSAWGCSLAAPGWPTLTTPTARRTTFRDRSRSRA